MRITFQSLFLVFMLNAPSVFASHSFGGLDMCAVYPEIMPPGLTPDLLPDVGGPDAALMETYCTQCHALPGPGPNTKHVNRRGKKECIAATGRLVRRNIEKPA